MSEATTKALTDLIYDAFGEAPATTSIVHDLNNGQIYSLACVAAETIESAGTTKAIIRTWLELVARPLPLCYALTAAASKFPGTETAAMFARFSEAVREVSS